MSIVVFDPMAESYEGNGEAVLVPLECRVRMAAGGEYSFSMDHPIDPWGKWTRLVREAIVRLPVPAERIENSFTGIEADIYTANADTEMRDGTTKPSTISYNAWSQYNTYSVGSKVTSQSRNYQCVYWDSNSTYRAERPGASSWWKEIARTTPGSPVLMNVPQGTKLYYVSDAGSGWYKMSTYYGLEGYIESSKLTFDHHSSQSENQPREITEQLFRIREVNIDRTGGKVSVSGVHVSYDLNGVLVEDIEIGQASPAMAIGRLTEAMLGDYPGMIATDMDDTDATFTGSFKKKNAMSCLTDPDSGIVPAFGAKFTRDNWDLFVMEDPETDRGYRIRYGKNADGIQWKIRSDGLITRVMPVAKNEDGSDLYLPELFVDSAHIGEYPVVYMESLSVKGQVGKDDGSGTDTVWTEEALLEEMRAKAAERFSVAKVDEPATEVTVQLEQLEKTDEFKYLRNLMRVNLYDVVKAEDPEIGLDISLKVTEIEFDAIREKIAGIKVANTGGSVGRTVTGYNVVNKSIGLEKLKDEVATGILDTAVMQAVQDAEQRMPVVPDITVYDGLDSTSATDALSANQGRVLNGHYQTIGASSNPCTDLANIPLNSTGNVVLSGTISPTGTTRSCSYWKSGLSDTRYSIVIVDQYDNRLWEQTNYDGTLSGWHQADYRVQVVDNLNSTSATDALSANQGNVLADRVSMRVDTASLSDFNNAPNGLCFATNSSMSNAPATGGYWFMMTYAAGTGTRKFQFAMQTTTGKTFVRGYGSSAGWGSWTQL